MRLHPWLGFVVLIAGAGCGDDAEPSGGGSGDDSKAVAEALTSGVEFDRGIVRDGAIPEASADTVRLSEDDGTLRLKPGDATLMSLDVENPDEDTDPIEATLVQFEDSEDHVEIPADGTDAGVDAGTGGTMRHFELSFTVGADVCDELCNKVFTLRMIQAARTRDGKVSRHLLRTLELDCREDGDADRCEDSEQPERDAGSSSGGSGGGGPPTVAANIASALASVNTAACECEAPMTCDTQVFPTADIGCIEDAITENMAFRSPASCLDLRLTDALIASCGCTATCFPALVAMANGMCPADPAFEEQLQTCNLLEASSAMDAGVPPDGGI